MISGGIKLFQKSKSFAGDGVTIAASSGDASSIRAIDKNPITYWRSVSSNDTVDETITITFPETTTFNRLILVDHNWRDFTVTYYSGGSYVAFTNVVGLDGSISGINETTFADDTAYYEFNSVSTNSIQIVVETTQTANQEKYINQIICTEELGTLQGYPDISGLTLDRNSREKKMLSGRSLIMKSDQTFDCGLKFTNYPPSYSADIDLIFSLFDLEDPFLIWLCGGRRGSTYFRKQLRGYRLKDIFQVQTTSKIEPDYRSNVYVNPVNFSIQLNEAVD